MAFERPSLTQLVTRIEGDLSARLGTGPLLEKGVLKVLARVLAGGAHLLHGHQDFIAKQIIWDTAEAEYLERWASIWGLTRKAASFATGDVTFTGVDGNTVPAGTALQRADGAEFLTDASADILSGSVTVSATAVLAGTDGNTALGTTLQLTSPVAAIDSTATVAGTGIATGAEAESDADFLERFLTDRRTPPQGGAAADYVKWALEVPGVTRAFALPQHQGVGTVGVTFMVDDETDPIPDAGKVAEVQAAIELERPVTATVVVFAPTEVTYDPTISIKPNTGDVRAEVTLALEDLLQRESEPGGTLLLSRVREAIATTPGEEDHVLDSPTTNVTVAAGELLTLGTITFLTLV